MKRILLALGLLGVAGGVSAAHIRETFKLEKGWNAVYFESTPDNSLCEEFFRDLPVTAAAAYRSDADASTAQYAADGSEIVQKPVSYLQWVRGASVSTLSAITGGSSYLIYATSATDEIVFYGVPQVPHLTWRKTTGTSGDEFFNLAGVSSSTPGVTAAAYFAEGPFGDVKADQKIWGVAGTNDVAPELKTIASFGRPAMVVGGKAYALSATRSGDWPGVIGIDGPAELAFSSDGSLSMLRIRNCGTKAHTFSIKVVGDEADVDRETMPPLRRRLPRAEAIRASDFTNVLESVAWTVRLEADATSEQVFGLDRAQLVPGTRYGAILVIEEPETQMRVRLPVSVLPIDENAVVYPTGLWCGEIVLSKVSGLYDATPVTAGGALKMNVMMHVDNRGACTLLQRVTAGVDTNGAERLFLNLSRVPADVENPRRISTVLMSVEKPVVPAVAGAVFGQEAAFDWTVDAKARDNPYRHAWHPDHDGKKADYSGDLPAGDDFSLYANPVKPELWSVRNRLTFLWSEFPVTADETTAGTVVWEVEGLLSKGPIKSVGTFALRRVVKAKKLED